MTRVQTDVNAEISSAQGGQDRTWRFAGREVRAYVVIISNALPVKKVEN